MTVLGTSKVSTDKKITIVKRAAEELGIKEGDMVGFYEDEKGNIFIKKVVLKPES